VDVLASRILLHPSDLERSLRFYGETLGLAVFREWRSGCNRGVVFFVARDSSRSRDPRASRHPAPSGCRFRSAMSTRSGDGSPPRMS
jgi:hypothetical protein